MASKVDTKVRIDTYEWTELEVSVLEGGINGKSFNGKDFKPMRVKTPTSLPKGMTLEDYDKEDDRKYWKGVDPSPEVEDAANQLIESGGQYLVTLDVPKDSNARNFMAAIRAYLRRRQYIVRLGGLEDKIYGRLLEET